MGNSTCVDQWLKLYYLPTAYSLIFAVGLVGNVTAIALYLTKLRPLKTSSILMINLALTDLIYVLSLPFLVHYYSNGDLWVFGNFMCLFVRVVFHSNLYGSILCLTCLAIFRYVVVARPLLAAQVQQSVWGVTACWLISMLVMVAMLPMFDLLGTSNSTCLDFGNSEPALTANVYNLTLTTAGFLLPLVVVCVCCIGIVKKLGQGPSVSVGCRMKAQRVTVLILVMFVLCFLPYHILRLVHIQLRLRTDVPALTHCVVHTAYIISRPLAGFNTFFNLAFYTLSGSRFRKAFVGALHECWPRPKPSCWPVLSSLPKNASNGLVNGSEASRGTDLKTTPWFICISERL